MSKRNGKFYKSSYVMQLRKYWTNVKCFRLSTIVLTGRICIPAGEKGMPITILNELQICETLYVRPTRYIIHR